MSKNQAYIDEIVLSPSLSLAHCTDKRKGDFGFWLYDETRGMNLAVRAETERAAFVEALEYYQARLATVEKAHASMTAKVFTFIEQFSVEASV